MTITNTEGLSELLPCPFCGGEAFSGTTLDGSGYAMCKSDECWGMAGYLPTEAEARTAWNHRAANSAGGVEMEGAVHVRCGYPDCGGECVGCEQGDATRSRAPTPAVEAEPVAWQWTYSIEEGGRVLGPFYGALPPDLSEYPNQKVIPLYTHSCSSVSAEVTAPAIPEYLPATKDIGGDVVVSLTAPSREVARELAFSDAHIYAAIRIPQFPVGYNPAKAIGVMKTMRAALLAALNGGRENG